MAGYRAVQLFNLAVPADGEPVPALQSIGFPATFRITMAAIDPVQSSATKGETNGAPSFIGSTLRIIRIPEDSDDEESDDEDSMDMADLLDDGSDEDESDDDEEINGGPSDPSKSPKAKRMAALKAALENGEHEDVEMNGDSTLTAKAKGKGKAIDMDIDDMEDSDDESDPEGAEEFVICTLDPSKSYQQPLDITINEHEMVYFSAMGSHDVFLTGNVLIPDDGSRRGEDMYDSDEDEDYDLEPDEDELDFQDAEDESDELDDLDDPRITELVDDEDEEDSSPPQLVKTTAETKKGKNKRAHEDSEIETPEKATIDSTLNKALKPSSAPGPEDEEKAMSKSQLKKMRKKMKDNAGNPVDTTSEDVGTKVSETTPKSDKKVQFAKTLVQGPSGAAQPNGDIAKVKTEKKAVDGAPKVNGETKPAATTKGERVVQGVTVDDRKLGSGPAAKKGDKVSMRYIGKLEKDKKVFDANKKGPPFTFKLGAGQVIKGWDIGIQGITVGGERRITVPAHLAYGSKSMPDIPANSTLIFDVKCLEIK